MLKKGRGQESGLAERKKAVLKRCAVLRLYGKKNVTKVCGNGLLIGKYFEGK